MCATDAPEAVKISLKTSPLKRAASIEEAIEISDDDGNNSVASAPQGSEEASDSDFERPKSKKRNSSKKATAKTPSKAPANTPNKAPSKPATPTLATTPSTTPATVVKQEPIAEPTPTNSQAPAAISKKKTAKVKVKAEDRDEADEYMDNAGEDNSSVSEESIPEKKTKKRKSAASETTEGTATKRKGGRGKKYEYSELDMREAFVVFDRNNKGYLVSVKDVDVFLSVVVALCRFVQFFTLFVVCNTLSCAIVFPQTLGDFEFQRQECELRDMDEEQLRDMFCEAANPTTIAQAGSSSNVFANMMQAMMGMLTLSVAMSVLTRVDLTEHI